MEPPPLVSAMELLFLLLNRNYIVKTNISKSVHFGIYKKAGIICARIYAFFILEYSK